MDLLSALRPGVTEATLLMPVNILGILLLKLKAAVEEFLAGSAPMSAFIQPCGWTASSEAVSMISCASKCERTLFGMPEACTKVRLPLLQNGIRGASEGCSPKKLSR